MLSSNETNHESATDPSADVPAAPAPAAPAAPVVPKIALAVGESAAIDQKYLDDVIASERALHQQLLNLGAHAEKAHVEGMQLQAQVTAARQTFTAKVREAGIACGLNFDGDYLYNYSQEKRSFTRTK
jgi:hypothetical protein